MKALFTIAICFLFLACKPTKSELVGEWKLKDIDVEKAVSNFAPDQKAYAKTMMTQIFQFVKGKMTLSFEENGKYTIQTPLQNGSTQAESGKWTLSKDGKKLSLRLGNGETEAHRILKLNPSELKMEMKMPGFSPMEMSFVKN